LTWSGKSAVIYFANVGYLGVLKNVILVVHGVMDSSATDGASVSNAIEVSNQQAPGRKCPTEVLSLISK